MSEALLADFFVEDTAHRQLIVPLAERVAREEEVDLRCQVRNARGGHAGAMGSFRRYQILREKGVGGTDLPTLLVVAIDGNCSTFSETRRNKFGAPLAIRSPTCSSRPAPTHTSSAGIWQIRSHFRVWSEPCPVWVGESASETTTSRCLQRPWLAVATHRRSVESSSVESWRTR